MALAFTEEQEQLRSVVRNLLGSRSAEGRVRELMATEDGFDVAVWKELAELGLLGLIVEERYGGAGGTVGDVCVVMEEMGRALLCAPYLASAVMATTALQVIGDDAAKQRWLPALAAGDLRASVAWADADGRWDVATDTTASTDGARWTVAGSKAFVLDARTADLLLVTASTPDGVSLFAVDASASGVERRTSTTLDQTRRLGAVTLAGAPATLVGTLGAAERDLPAVLDLCLVALSAEAVGGAQRVLEMSVDYAKLREQFGRPIGSFQAIKHKCADMLTQVELSRSLMLAAQDAASSGSAGLPKAARMAKAFAADAYFACAAENIQIHGGIGFTWEHPAHLYFRRAKSAQVLLGGACQLRAEVADLLDAEAAALVDTAEE